jgi:hypothetical protein
VSVYVCECVSGALGSAQEIRPYICISVGFGVVVSCRALCVQEVGVV